MDQKTLEDAAEKYLNKLCVEISSRRVGSRGNQAATRFFRRTMQDHGLLTEVQPFDCLDQHHGDINLLAGGKRFAAFISPYSLGCDCEAELACSTSLEDLEKVDAARKILLLKGELAKEQLTPRNYPFYNVESHQCIYELLDAKKPAAIIAATGHNPNLAGAVYPFPLIEDGNFNIPSAYMTDVTGEELAEWTGKPVILRMDAQRIPAGGENVITNAGPAAGERLVICAHIDAKEGTPGAVDNACGIVTLLLLAELLRVERLKVGVEIVALNGEDDYSAGGEKAYLAAKREALGDILFAINLDGLGFRGFPTMISFFNLPQVVEEQFRALLPKYTSLVVGEPWYQSDHMIFVMNQVPAVAITTVGFNEMEATIAHTEKDRPEMVDLRLLADAALFLRDFLEMIGV